jgi:DNA-binding Lrp family transcriptional regulator
VHPKFLLLNSHLNLNLQYFLIPIPLYFIAILLRFVKVGKEDETFQQLRKIQGVSEIFQIFGSYEIILKIEAENTKRLAEIVANKIRKIDTVHSTVTSIVAES